MNWRRVRIAAKSAAQAVPHVGARRAVPNGITPFSGLRILMGGTTPPLPKKHYAIFSRGSVLPVFIGAGPRLFRM
jgi:hypothetical protein